MIVYIFIFLILIEHNAGRSPPVNKSLNIYINILNTYKGAD